MKYSRPRAMYGCFKDQPTAPTFLGIVEYQEETNAMIAEYHGAFGKDNILLFTEYASPELYHKEKQKALAGVFGSLFGPINVVMISLQQ